MFLLYVFWIFLYINYMYVYKKIGLKLYASFCDLFSPSILYTVFLYSTTFNLL